MNLYLKAMVIMAALVCILCIGGAAEKTVDTKGSGTAIPVQFFYDSTCGSCEKVLPFMEGFEANQTGVTVEMFDIYQNKTNDDHFKSMINSTGTKDGYVPMVFVGNVSLVGDESIEKDLAATVESARANLTEKI